MPTAAAHRSCGLAQVWALGTSFLPQTEPRRFQSGQRQLALDWVGKPLPDPA
ncbi:MAG: hypothetical protein M3Q40_03445 [Pseudomonadota bacterium]|nr:hypothetical protein [Pseudomonadota bacterium]